MIRLVILRFLESYFRHRWLWLAPIVLLAIFAGINFVRAKPIYISRGAMYVQRHSLLATLTTATNDGSLWITPADQTVAEFKELMQTDAFVRAMIQKTDLEPEMAKGSAVVERVYADVRRAVWVQSLGNNLVMIGATHEKAELAQQLAAALIATYQQWRINSDQQESATAQQFFDGLIQKYQDDLTTARNALKTYLDQHPDPARGDRPSIEKMDIERLQGAIDLSLKQLGSALDKEENARLNMSRAESDVKQKYYVIDAPNFPEEPENSKKQAATNSAIFVVIGVVLSVGGVVGGALLDRALRFPVDVRHILNLPVLASIPEPKIERAKKKK
jgi:capsular polysaccharide biosynthesis protein